MDSRRALPDPLAHLDVLSVLQVLGCTLEVRKLREDGMDYRRSTKPGQITEGISLLHDYDAAARARARQEQTLPRDADYDEHDEVKARKLARDRERYRRQSQPRTQWHVPTEAEREEACKLPDPLAHIDGR